MKFLFPVFIFCVSSIFAQNYPELIPYKKGELWGYCDSNKIVKITPRFKGLSFFKENNTAVVVINDSTRGIINKKGELLSKIPYWDLYCLRDYYFQKNNDYRYRLVDPSGKALSNFVYNLDPDAHLSRSNDLIKESCIVIKDSAMTGDWNYGLIDKNGKELIPFHCRGIIL